MMNGYYGGSYGNMMSGGGSWLLMILGGLFFFLLIVGGIVLFIWAISHGNRPNNLKRGEMMDANVMHGGKQSDEDCLAILKTRYAKGEIDKQQFEAMKKDCNVE
jgi:uncharacterized membrane protein